MLARASALSLFTTVALSLAADPAAPHFTLESSGALRLRVSNTDAHYELLPEPFHERPILGISLGAKQGEVALLLYTYADEPLQPGRYPVASSLPEDRAAGRWFHPCVVAGTVERPAGFFHGESGWVTITAVESGRIVGKYEMRARGFLAADTTNENEWVTIRGTFGAAGDSVIATVAAASAVTQ
jgi:hypothetical protein